MDYCLRCRCVFDQGDYCQTCDKALTAELAAANTELARMRARARWLIDDLAYKAPEQWGQEVIRERIVEVLEEIAGTGNGE